MNRTAAISQMLPPGRRRPGKYMEGVIQIWVTRMCDQACTHCTQACNYSVKGLGQRFITPKQFEAAVVSLKDYWGVVGMFGGNPAIHPLFNELCHIIERHIPKNRRGIWCNNPLTVEKAILMRRVFNPSHSNINVHMNQRAWSLFKQGWPECQIVGLDRDSLHSPVFTSIKDLVPLEEDRWNYISNCDINKHWSPMIGVFRGELRAWFCEIAGSISMLRQDDLDFPDIGLEVSHGWWKKPIQNWTDQIDVCCHRCGVPLRGRGRSAVGDHTDLITPDYTSFCKPIKTRFVKMVYSLDQIEPGTRPFIKYLEK